ncbi:MAG: OB-fold nucleic acid binding domain-containing protein [Candidatus Nanoarchaeia archaeon]|nr:OB-fold nucleic acid binding domain-containing protein [Candidatus Nanoarchaeia archaeon]MDD5587764.1 OB-fold nucleic acid binding domain-containing protein [Candidatus Nanoarchaeia archaeon]
MADFIRQVAYKVWIRDLVNCPYYLGELESSYSLINNKRVSRAHVVATVIQKFESENKEYLTMTIDDGSGDIRIKTWKEDIKLISTLQVGDLVLVIGKVKKYNDEIYLVPEIVKKVDPNYEIVHKAELLSLYKDFKTPEKAPEQEVLGIVEEKIIDE